LNFEKFSKRHFNIHCDQQELPKTRIENKNQSRVEEVIVVPVEKKKNKKKTLKKHTHHVNINTFFCHTQNLKNFKIMFVKDVT